MKGSDRAIIMGIAVAILAVGFYLMVLSPKRQKAAELNTKIDDLNASISEQEEVVQFGEEARKGFPQYYGRLVVLGKAVPEQADSASMLVQLNSIASSTHVDFRGLKLGQGGGTGASSTSTQAPATSGAAVAAPSAGAAVPPTGGSGTGGAPATGSTGATGTPAAATTSAATTSSTGATTGSTTGAAPAAAPAAPATEASAASQPIGAVVGPAGLPTLPYELTFKGGYFDVANFIGGVDSLVQMNDAAGQVAANGRLFTVDGFALEGGAPGSNPTLDANFVVTSFVAPSMQGLTAGASPTGPAPTNPAQPQTTPASSTGTVSP